jgi:hypothetical protein
MTHVALTIDRSCAFYILMSTVDIYGSYTCGWCFGRVNSPRISYNLG